MYSVKLLTQYLICSGTMFIFFQKLKTMYINQLLAFNGIMFVQIVIGVALIFLGRYNVTQEQSARKVWLQLKYIYIFSYPRMQANL